jgi:hypothetical protein
MAATYKKIASTTLGSNQTDITLSSIPATYTDLVLVFQYASQTNDNNAYMYFNSSQGTAYSRTYAVGSPNGATSARNSNSNKIDFTPQIGAGTSLNTPGLIIANIFNYSNTTTYKSVTVRDNATKNDGNQQTMIVAGLWRSTAAINSVTVGTGAGYLVSGTSVTIYGIKAA